MGGRRKEDGREVRWSESLAREKVDARQVGKDGKGWTGSGEETQ